MVSVVGVFEKQAIHASCKVKRSVKLKDVKLPR